MVTVKVESKEQMEFLQIAFKHAWKINGCDASDIWDVAKQIETLSLENQTLELTKSQAIAFRIVMALYNDLSADYVTWSDDLMKQLPATVKDAPRFYAMLKGFGLNKYAKEAWDLFKYWVTQDWSYFNSVLINLIDSTSDLSWMSVMHWCRSNNPSDTEIDDEIDYYKKEYCK